MASEETTVYPVVSGVHLADRLSPEVRDKIFTDPERFIEAADDPLAVYWHRLSSEDLRPTARN